MMVHRFIGLSEIEVLLNDGVVNPLTENNRNCLYFFDSNEHGCPGYTDSDKWYVVDRMKDEVLMEEDDVGCRGGT